MVALVGSIIFNPKIDWTSENQKYKAEEPSRKKKAIQRSKRSANAYLVQRIADLEDQNYELSTQISELKAFLKYNN